MTFVPISKQELTARLGLAKFPPNLQEEFFTRSLELIQKRIVLKLLDYLENGHKSLMEHFQSVVSSENDQRVAEWIGKNVPEVQEWLKEEIRYVRGKVIYAH